MYLFENRVFPSCYSQAAAGPQVVKARWCFRMSILIEGHFYVPHQPLITIYTHTHTYIYIYIYFEPFNFFCVHFLPGLADLTRNYPHDLLLWQLMGAALTDERPVDP